jgi:signal transduction histidine kinase
MSDSHGRVLVVDDNRVSRQKLALSLGQQGHAVETAEDGQQALDMLRAGGFDVVLLDILMPGMDGHEVLARMKADPELRDLPVIVISALDEIESVVRCIEMGAEDYLPKTFDPVVLRARLNASLQKKALRDLEKRYLQQEVTLRQSEKLATLGRLSAGMAHELNNPAAAARRGSARLLELLPDLQAADLALGTLGLPEAMLGALQELADDTPRRAAEARSEDAIVRSDRQAALEDWLADHELDRSWELGPRLSDRGIVESDLEPFVATLEPAALAVVVDWLACRAEVDGLLEEIREGVGRISEIVKALKSYAYLDQAPVQAVDIREGLENTLVILRSKLRDGVEVRRDYAPGLPSIEGFGSELNQAWTNLIDNAIDAMDGRGQLTLRTRFDDASVTVEVEDTGPGIPEALRASIFDPFVTSKPPGQGTGLGLNITHTIVVQKHQGRIDVESEPGRTRFIVRLPRSHVPADPPGQHQGEQP